MQSFNRLNMICVPFLYVIRRSKTSIKTTVEIAVYAGVYSIRNNNDSHLAGVHNSCKTVVLVRLSLFIFTETKKYPDSDVKPVSSEGYGTLTRFTYTRACALRQRVRTLILYE